MKGPIRRIAIVGAGVAGSRLATMLADRGKEVLVFDHRAPWEKPCGGGITPRARVLIPEAGKMDLQEREHERLALLFPSGRRIRLSLTWPIVTVSRARLGRGLLDQCLRAGAKFHDEKVQAVAVADDAAVVRTAAGEYEADVVVGADGVNSLVRQTFARRVPRQDLCLAYTALIPITVKLPLILKFFKGVEGYAWIFPRTDATSVGIAMEQGQMTHQDLQDRLAEFVSAEFRRAGLDDPGTVVSRGRYLPSLRAESYANPALAGERWALTGDASGACDPITGEGIYYALQTAQFLSQALTSGTHNFSGTYIQSWREMALDSLARASGWRGRFYLARNLNLLGYCIDYSPGIRNLTRDLLSGVQEYNSLKIRIYSRWPRYARETLINTLVRKKGERG